ncbi:MULTISPECIES: hypothetical protein [Bacillus]|uniref:hypothetical protein n=1 Tax=Bacillus TaxID=1386 RepID=UPI0002DB90F8|nr:MULTISPECIES: hypothetical protein [Bacillus]
MTNNHARVNLHIPGPGVGGHCHAVNPFFIAMKSTKTAQLINLSRTINTSMPNYVVENVNKLMEQVKGKIITTYKGNVDDIRESLAMEIYEILQDQTHYEVRSYHPND